MSHNFTLSSEIVSVSDIITSKVMHSLSVTDKNWLSSFNGFSLHFHSEVRVGGIDDPSADIVLIRVNTGFLFARLGRVAKSAQGSAANKESLSVNVGIRFNFDFLAVPNNVIRAEDVSLLGLLNAEHGASNGTRVFLAGSEHESITGSSLLLLVHVHDKVTTSGFVLHHNRVS